ncbi:hypothetical protein O0L34_g14908 [Tuta absoluta]|nr:hypothetical protein O0L34_g14908 [Tuta absoluta]
MKGYKGARIFQNTSPGEGTVKSAIAIFDPNLDVTQYPELTTNNIAVVRIRTSAWSILLIAYYFEPDSPIEPYLNQLRGITEKLGADKIIIGGDCNAKSIWWGGDKDDCRGEEMLGALDEIGLQILNVGTVPTFDVIRGDQHLTSYIDVTACSPDLLDRITDWKVIENLTSSDHNGIEFGVKTQKSKGTEIKRTTRKFNTKKADWTKFRETLIIFFKENNLTTDVINKINSPEQLDNIAEKYTGSILDSAAQHIPKKKDTETLKLPWWSEELEKMKKSVKTMKRRIRWAAPVRKQRVINEYLEVKEKYELAAAQAQIDSWREFCEKQEMEGLWEGIYRVISRTKKREEDVPLQHQGRILNAEESVALLADTFYPKDDERLDSWEHREKRQRAEQIVSTNDIEDDPLFTLYELDRTIASFNPKKAPGDDGLTADICAQAIATASDTFLALLNRCLVLGHFPKIWKRATVIILRKPNKESYSAPKSFRPIGLLPLLGKVFEKLVVARLRFHILPNMSRKQYGFMPQRSTEDSLYVLINYIRSKLEEKKIVTLISLDIEGAFDSAWWPAIRLRLVEEKCPGNLRRVIDSYLTDGSVAVRYLGAQHVKKTEKGCVQGSIGGPILWNLLLDPLLKGLEQRGDYVQAFADDVVLVFDGDTAQQIQGQANASLAYVREWGVANKLRFAPQKTNAMLITRKLKHDTPHLTMGGTDIEMSKEIKLLGLTIDNNLTFNKHVANVCTKATAIYKQLSKAARVSWGLHPEIIKTIYTAAVEPVVLYAASAWAPAANKLGIRKKLNSVQRSFAQKMCKAYRTTSLNSTLVLAGLLPLDLRIHEVAMLYKTKKGVPHPALGDREVERPGSALKAPHPASKTKLKLERLEDIEQYNESSKHQVRIFTDGSKIGGRVGAAFTLMSGETEVKALKLALPTYSTVYQAELLALNRAVKELTKRPEKDFAILSDSMAALQTVANPDALHPLAIETRENIKVALDQCKVVTLYWIKAHIGLEGNERADALAKEAAMGSKKKPDYDACPVSFVKRVIRWGTLSEWDRRYAEGETATTTKLFFPSAVAAYSATRKIKIDKHLTQALTGHGGFSEYLTKFRCKENPSCTCDPDKGETIEHLLTECPTFGRKRFEIEQKLDTKINIENLPALISGKKVRNEFIEYVKEIVKDINKRNK